MLCPIQGPTGAEKEGDGGPRVCAIMAHQALADHFFFISLFWYTFSGIGTRSGEASLVEVYPWKEERLELLQYRPWIGGAFFTFYLICNVMITSINEQTTDINGSIGFRNIISIIYPIVCCFSFLSFIAMKDAKQVSRKDEKAVNILVE